MLSLPLHLCNLSWPKCAPLLPHPFPRKHLSIRRFSWWTRFIAINTFLFFLFFFLTTPAIIINTIDMYNVTRPIENLQVPPLLRPDLDWGGVLEFHSNSTVEAERCHRQGKVP